MSTRSRRSIGGENEGIHVNRIPLYPVSRLKEELQKRNLPITGSKDDLIYRLIDAVEGNVPQEVASQKPAPRGRKVVVKTESVEEEIPVIKEEVPDEDKQPKKSTPKRTPTKRARKTNQEPTEETETAPEVEQQKSPEKKKIRIKEEPVDEEGEQRPKKKKSRKSVEDVDLPSTSNQHTAQSPEKAPTPMEEDLNEDVPLLSLLSRKKVTIKTEIVEEETDSAAQKPTHGHGTRRATAMMTQSTVVVEQKRFIEQLRGDVFDDDDSHDYIPPETSSHRRETREEREKVTRQRSEEERPKERIKKTSISGNRPIKIEPPPLPRPPQKTTVSLWTEKFAQLKKAQEQQKEAEQKPEIAAKPVSRTTSESKNRPTKPAPVMSNPLDDILTKKEQAELEAKRKKEEEERLAREEEHRRREKMAEYRRRKAEEDARRAERLKNLPPGALKPKPIVEPKMVEQKLHPYAIPQPILQTTPSPAPVKPASSIQTTPATQATPKIAPIIQTNVTPAARGQPLPKPGLVIPQRIGPPPPPPKKEKSRGEPASSTSPTNSVVSVTSQKLLPPPPPPKKVPIQPAAQPPVSQPSVSQETRSQLMPAGPPPPPPPRKPKADNVKVEPREEPTEKVTKENEKKTQEENATPTEGDVDPTLVSSITEALLKVMQQHNEVETKPVVENREEITEKTPENMENGQDARRESPASREKPEDREPGEEPQQYEEYDPAEEDSLDVSAYIPSTIISRNQTIIEDEESDEEPSDDEIAGEMDDEDESDEDESEDEITSQSLQPAHSSPQKRATAGRDVESLLQNPRDLLMKANAVVFTKTDESVDGPQYVQMPSAEDYEPEEEKNKTPEYHGEPVPSDDEIDFFELGAGIQKPKKKKDIVVEEEKLPSDESIEPDYYNADLHIKGATDKNWQIEPENADGLAIMWGGVRSTYGIRLPFRDVRNQSSENENDTMEIDGDTTTKQNSKKIVFQIKITEFLSTKHLPFEEMDPHDVRVGFSLRSAPNALGEYPNSWCITSLGKKATNNFFSDFGNAFHQNDVVTACIDLEECNISYWKNDEYLGIAFSNINLPDGEAIFPHICIKNCNVAVNLGEFKGDDEDHPWRRIDECRFMTDLGRGDLERSLKSPESKTQCTVIMMVGLPGVGKTTWVREYLRDHPEEHWTLINTESVLSAMKVNGVSRQRAHQGRWDMIMGLIGKSLQRSVLLAARRRKNYILDMTNTSRDTRKKRLQLFEEFQRKCVIIMPSDEDILDRQARQARQEGTALMPPEAMLEMKAVISLPAQDQEPFEDIYFIEPQIHRVQECIDQINRYNEEARPWFQKKYRRRRSQMIGLGDGIPRDPMMPRKPVQPLTVLPQLKIAVVPLDDPSNQPLSANASGLSSGPKSASALGFTVVEDRTPTRPPVAISIDTSIPPPQIVPSAKPLVRVTIEDIPSTDTPQTSDGGPRLVSSPFVRRSSGAGVSSVEEQISELTEEELKELREAVKSANPSGNPMMSEAIMRSRLKALQVKKQEKKSVTSTTPKTEAPPSLSATPVMTVPPPTPITGTPISVIGGRNIPTIGSQNNLSIDTSQMHTAMSFASTSNSSSPHVTAPSPTVSVGLPPPGLAAPYLAPTVRPQNGFSHPPPMSPQIPMPVSATMGVTQPSTSYPSFTQPPPSFGNFQPNVNVPPPNMFTNNIPNTAGYPMTPFPWPTPSSGI